MSLSASVCSRLQYQHETIQELLNGSSEGIFRQRIHKDKRSAQNAPTFKRYVAGNNTAASSTSIE
jgi:hypothetical protein